MTKSTIKKDVNSWEFKIHFKGTEVLSVLMEGNKPNLEEIKEVLEDDDLYKEELFYFDKEKIILNDLEIKKLLRYNYLLKDKLKYFLNRYF